jgi:GT2 family glycosyltransferase
MPGTMAGGRPWPRICIVTPSYNQASFLEETLRSVLLQGYPNLEYIVMDGGSDDGSVEVLRKYEPWLSYLRIGPDEGQAAAIAEGFQRSKAEIMAWLNSDDRYEPGTLQRIATYFSRHPRVVFVTSNVYDMDAQGSLAANSEYRFIASPCRMLTANLGWHNWPQPGSFWRSRAYEECGGIDPSFRFSMDRDLFLRLTALGPARRLKGPPTAVFRYHDHSKTVTLQHVREEESRLIIKKYSHPLLVRAQTPLQIWRRCWLLPAKMRRLLYLRYGWEI